MQLSDIRQEILNHGFDPVTFPTTRLNQYINDGQNLIYRRLDYYNSEASATFTTSSGLGNYPLAGVAGTTLITDFARLRSVYDGTRDFELEPVSARDMDRSSQTRGAPMFYAIDGAQANEPIIRLYPIPDGVYTLTVRYWKMPPTLALDSDVPALPTDWHHLLWVYACWICYEAEDDATMGQYWQQRFQNELAEFEADQKFPSTDYPNQAVSMWDQDRTLSNNGWSLYWGF